MTKKRKKYTEEFRSSAVKLVTEQGYQITEAARNLGINATMLGRWKREVEDNGNGKPEMQELVSEWLGIKVYERLAGAENRLSSLLTT